MALKAYEGDNNITKDESNGTWVKVPNGDGTSGTDYAKVCYAMLITKDGAKLELCPVTNSNLGDPIVNITINASGLTIQPAT